KVHAPRLQSDPPPRPERAPAALQEKVARGATSRAPRDRPRATPTPPAHQDSRSNPFAPRWPAASASLRRSATPLRLGPQLAQRSLSELDPRTSSQPPTRSPAQSLA